MAKLAPPKKASKPTAPKKPTSRSKTGNAACSSAASNWQLALRGKAALDPETYRTLAKCRAMNRTAKMAEAQGRTGKLSAMGESAVKARLQARFDSGLITQKARTERLDMLLKQRSQAIEKGKSSAVSDETVTRITKRAEVPSSEILMTGFRWKPDGSLQVDKGRYQAAITDEINASLTNMRGGQKARKSLKEGLANIPKTDPMYPKAKEFIEGRIREIPFENLAERAKVQTLETLKTKFASNLTTKTKNSEKAKILGSTAKSLDIPSAPILVQRGTDSGGGETIPPKPAARYSLGGKLAPGRGTEERKKAAKELQTLRGYLGGKVSFDEVLKVKAANDAYGELKYKAERYAPSQRVEMAKGWESNRDSVRWIAKGNRDFHNIAEKASRTGKITPGMTNEQAMKAFDSQRQENALDTARVRITHLASNAAGKKYRGEAEETLAKFKQPSPTPAARYSLGGKLAPGRGTEERKATAEFLRSIRKSGLMEKSQVGRTSLMIAQDIRTGANTPDQLTATMVEMRTKAFLEMPSEYRTLKGRKISERMDARLRHHASTDIIARHALGEKGYENYVSKVQEATKAEIEYQQKWFLRGYDKQFQPVENAYKLIYPKPLSGKAKRGKLAR